MPRQIELSRKKKIYAGNLTNSANRTVAKEVIFRNPTNSVDQTFSKNSFGNPGSSIDKILTYLSRKSPAVA